MDDDDPRVIPLRDMRAGPPAPPDTRATVRLLRQLADAQPDDAGRAALRRNARVVRFHGALAQLGQRRQVTP